jgi:ABC-type tungstate transport system substrate-binding protein
MTTHDSPHNTMIIGQQLLSLFLLKSLYYSVAHTVDERFSGTETQIMASYIAQNTHSILALDKFIIQHTYY